MKMNTGKQPILAGVSVQDCFNSNSYKDELLLSKVT